jgi:ABC-type bacteriocin/lantibiotic exporter with double-glycine peptidase domain
MKGKQMRFQKSKSSCGPAALANALECLGIRRTEDELQALCKTTPDGTNAVSLVKGVRALEGTLGHVIDESRADVAILRLTQSLYEGRPVIVCVNSGKPWDHYAVAGGFLGFNKSITCIDSGDNDLVRHRGLDEFIEWWRGPEGTKKPFWGVIV